MAAANWIGYLLWCAAVMGIVVLLGAVLLVFRRKIRADEPGWEGAEGFSIEALEVMRASGQISEAEFKALRRTALGLDTGGQSVDNAASSDDGGVPMNGISGDQDPSA